VRLHSLAAIAVICPQSLVFLYRHPTGFDNHRAELLAATVCLFSHGLLLAGVMACRDESEHGRERALVGESYDIVVQFRQHRHRHDQPEARHGCQKLVVLLVLVSGAQAADSRVTARIALRVFSTWSQSKTSDRFSSDSR